MDNPELEPISASVLMGTVSDFEDCELILGGAVAKALSANGAIAKQATRNNSAIMDLLFNEDIPSVVLASPYNNSGKGLKKEFADLSVDQLPTYVMEGGTFNNVQVYDSVRLAVAHGYCSPDEWDLYIMAAGEKAVAAMEVTRTEVVKAVQDRMTSIRNGVIVREKAALATARHEEAQAVEVKAAEEEGRKVKVLPLSDFEEKSGNSAKDPQDAAGEYSINAIKRLKRVKDADDVDYDRVGAIAAFRVALVCLNIKDSTTE